MTDATEKQINFAHKLNIDNPETFSKQALKELIDKALKARDGAKSPAVVQTSNPNVAVSQIVISRVEKPHSYEVGKAGARFKIYYSDVQDLKAHMALLKADGFLDENGNIEG